MQTNDDAWQIELFFDGDCPLCAREVTLMKSKNHDGLVRFTDLMQLPRDAEGVPAHEVLMERIHARTRDGEWVTGVEVFRRIYDLLGFRRLVRMSRLAPISALLNASYELFAKNRLRLTGRCDNDVCALPERPAH